MPVRLNSLELQGYKTFANRTLFEFAGRVTAIVGPNGSGKSNIADSLRWVLGEQSYSLLRGKKTEDMIFSGSEMRPRAGMASATITFDNQDGWLPIDFSEVAITRRAYRDGTNEYLINGQRVRLKDVSELLAQSGLAERTYTIIGQGLVDAALALKAEDRRRLFEEAAGIGLYRSRREEALRRLETTRRNLERVEDILAELEPRLRSLERQARRSQEYEQVRTDLQVLLRDWYGYHWHRTQQELMEAREIERQHAIALEKARQEQLALDTQITGFRQSIQAKRQQLSEWQRQAGEYRTRREGLSKELAVSDERAASLERQAQDTLDEIDRLAEDSLLLEELTQAVIQEAHRLEGEVNEARLQHAKARQALSVRMDERAGLERQIQEFRQVLGGLNARQGQLQARLAERGAQLERDQKALESASQAVQRLELELQEALLRKKAAQERSEAQEKAALEVETALQGRRQELRAQEESHQQINRAFSQSLAELERLKARAEVLEQAESGLVGYAEGTRVLLQAIRQDRVRGKSGALNQYLDVSSELERAISAALGEFLEAVLLDADLEEALQQMESQAGRVAILPLNQLKDENSFPPAQLGLDPAALLAEGWVGIASELVQTSSELRPALNLLLGSTWIVRDRAAARALLQSIAWADEIGPSVSRLRLATLDGELFFASGPVLSGQSTESSEAGSNVLARQRQRREIVDQRLQAEQILDGLRQERHQIELNIDGLQRELERINQEQRQARQAAGQASLAARQAELAAEQAERQAAWQHEQRQRFDEQIEKARHEMARNHQELEELSAKIQAARDDLRQRNSDLAGLVLDEYQTQVAHWNTMIAVSERALKDEQRRLEEHQANRNKSTARAASLKDRVEEIRASQAALAEGKEQARQQELQVNQDLERLQAEIVPVEAELLTLDKEQAALEEAEAAARQAVSLADHRYGQTRIGLTRRQESLQSLQRRIEEDFGLVAFEYADQVSGQAPLPMEGMVEQLPRLVQLPVDVDEAIKRQRAQLRRIGPINPDAQAEYRSVKERFQFMTGQVADLKHAEAGIHQVIQELDGLMERDFSKTFEAVAAEFKLIFQRLFGGGSARLVLTDPDNLTDTGIDIEARLPGRRSQGLSLLSGGERSLTATSLVFALMKVSPTPFCVLDEVDAMLDEANVGRFRDLLSELSDHTQFVIVTHNRNTVQAAEVIYGVTMGRDSASQVVSLKLDQVEEIFD